MKNSELLQAHRIKALLYPHPGLTNERLIPVDEGSNCWRALYLRNRQVLVNGVRGNLAPST